MIVMDTNRYTETTMERRCPICGDTGMCPFYACRFHGGTCGCMRPMIVLTSNIVPLGVQGWKIEPEDKEKT